MSQPPDLIADNRTRKPTESDAGDSRSAIAARPGSESERGRGAERVTLNSKHFKCYMKIIGLTRRLVRVPEESRRAQLLTSQSIQRRETDL